MFSRRTLTGLLLLLFLGSSLVAFVNNREAGGLRTALARAISSQQIASRLRSETENKLKEREKEYSALKRKMMSTEARAHHAETALQDLQSGYAGLQSKLQASEAELAGLRMRIAAEAGAGTPNPAEKVPGKMKAELDGTKRRNAKLEQENSGLQKKLSAVQERVKTMEEERRRRPDSAAKVAGIRGTVLAVNQAYNFVVLSIGERQGVGPNAEMLVLRSGTLIGRIRISSVEPTTSIGDIVTNSLARGVQVQPGDTVIYAGNASL